MASSTALQSKFAHAKGEVETPFKTDHPLHPATVHFPIALNIIAWALDILYALTAVVVKPRFLTSRFGQPSTLDDMSRLSYFMLCAGLLATIPAIMTGNKQLVDMIKKNGGVWEKDADQKPTATMVPRIRVTIKHALLNDLVFVVHLYSWRLRRSTDGRFNTSHAPSGTNLVISAVLLPLLLVSSKMGGHLVYNHGVGLNLGRKKLD